MVSLLSHLMNGLSLGSVYAIIALGYTMVYGIAKMLNFAHGDVIMIGAYISFCAIQYWNLPPAVAMVVAMLVCTVLGITIERLADKPLRKSHENPAVKAIYDEFFKKPGSHEAHELLHTHYTARNKY